MRCVLNGTKIEIPDAVVIIHETRGMVKVVNKEISESDVARADAAAQDINLEKNILPLNWRRLYFEIDNGVKTDSPVGQLSRKLDAIWEITAVNFNSLKKA